jgi:aromatic ring-opening dioxygenase LigB subunit
MNYTPNAEAIKALGFTQNAAWDVVIEVINVMIQQEVAIAIAQDISPDKRTHTAGRADALVDLNNYLTELRKTAVERHQRVVD